MSACLKDPSLASGVFKTGESENGEEEQENATDQTGPKTNLELSEEERRLLNDLRARDAEVRAHEQAHLAAAGPYANGAPTFEFQTGPDGWQYAVGGEVSIDTSPVRETRSDRSQGPDCKARRLGPPRSFHARSASGRPGGAVGSPSQTGSQSRKTKRKQGSHRIRKRSLFHRKERRVQHQFRE